jgi:hypothetical protein
MMEVKQPRWLSKLKADVLTDFTNFCAFCIHILLVTFDPPPQYALPIHPQHMQHTSTYYFLPRSLAVTNVPQKLITINCGLHSVWTANSKLVASLGSWISWNHTSPLTLWVTTSSLVKSR